MKALIIVDMQHDFITGSLATKGAEELIPIINEKVKDFDLIIFTQDFHTPNHKSFASNNEGKKPFDVITLENGVSQTLWPDHCVQGTPGVDIHSEILSNPVLKDKDFYIFKKGMNPKWDSHSGFYDNNWASTGLGEFLEKRGVTENHIVGLVTDFCILATALHSKTRQFETIVHLDGIKGVQPSSSEAAITRMKNYGIQIV